MRRIRIALLVILGTIFLSGPGSVSNGQNQPESCKCITDALTEIEKIKIGMKRKDLAKIFSLDGGLSPVDPQRFVYGKCLSIKVEVKFKFIDRGGGGGGFPKDDAEDEIVEISKPYLERPFFD